MVALLLRLPDRSSTTIVLFHRRAISLAALQSVTRALATVELNQSLSITLERYKKVYSINYSTSLTYFPAMLHLAFYATLCCVTSAPTPRITPLHHRLTHRLPRGLGVTMRFRIGVLSHFTNAFNFDPFHRWATICQVMNRAGCN
jgi:hypothetical protein